MYDYFEKLEQNPNIFQVDCIKYEDKFKLESESSQKVSLNSAKKLIGLDIRIYVDGPFGTASRRILDSEHAVLIAAGIVVTPFASILQSLKYVLQDCMLLSLCYLLWFVVLKHIIIPFD